MEDSAQKARFYDLIIGRAKKELDGCSSLNCDTANLIFRLIPELNIDECERMRNEFEKTLTNICVGWKGKKPDWRHYIKDSTNILLKIANDISNLIQDAPFEEKPAWKPSDEQMNELRVAAGSCFDLSFKTKNALKSLFNDLKKLQEEQVATCKNKPKYNIGDIIGPLNDELQRVVGIVYDVDGDRYILERIRDNKRSSADAHVIDKTAVLIQKGL